MPLQSRFYQVTPIYAAFKIFGIVVGITLVLLGLVYAIYAATRQRRRKPTTTTPHSDHHRDLEAGTTRRRVDELMNPRPRPHGGSSRAREAVGATRSNRNSCSAHSVDTLPRYEANNNTDNDADGQVPPSSERVLGGVQREGEGEGGEGNPPPYTIDARGPVVGGGGDSQGGGERTLAGGVTALAPVYFRGS